MGLVILKNKKCFSKQFYALKSKVEEKTYCECDFAMIRRDQKTQIAYCFECKKEIKEVEEKPKEETMLSQLKSLMVSTFRKKGDKDALIFKGKRRFTGNEIANEIEKESPIGIDMANTLLQLTIDLLMRDKLNQVEDTKETDS